VKKAMDNEEVRKQFDTLGFDVRYMDLKETATFWTRRRPRLRKVLPLIPQG